MKSKTVVLTSDKGYFEVSLKVNGSQVSMRVRGGEFLLDALRRYGWKSVKKGCDTGDCGSCTVEMDGRPVLACLIPAFTAHGSEIVTIEGVGSVHAPHPLQEAFVEAGAVQCGYCIPGMILSARALLRERPDPSEEEVRKYLDGNLCRCTGYVKQVRAVKSAAKKMRG